MAEETAHTSPTPTYGRVLGTRLDVTNYDDVLQRVIELAETDKVTLVAAANSHLVAEALDHRDFAAALESFDIVMPDGMPLVWALRAEGHALHDRVYGPYFMERVLRDAPSHFKHCFFGGTEDCLEKMQRRIREMNPQLQIAAAISPPFGKWDEATETAMVERINEAAADFVWVALGGVKQETWLARNRHRFNPGVYVGVGDAFALLAGMHAYAPRWMQRSGLGWLHRLACEPRRLLGRYLRYNTRFATAYLADRMRRAWT